MIMIIACSFVNPLDFFFALEVTVGLIRGYWKRRQLRTRQRRDRGRWRVAATDKSSLLIHSDWFCSSFLFCWCSCHYRWNEAEAADQSACAAPPVTPSSMSILQRIPDLACPPLASRFLFWARVTGARGSGDESYSTAHDHWWGRFREGNADLQVVANVPLGRSG